MDSLEYCPHRVLQELLLNWHFSKIELAKFIHSHSNRINAALCSTPNSMTRFFNKTQIEQILRIFKGIQRHEKHILSLLEERQLRLSIYTIENKENHLDMAS